MISLGISLATLSACDCDSVLPDVEGAPTAATAEDSGGPPVDAGRTTDSGPRAEADARIPSTPDAASVDGPQADNGPCDLTGPWLITQHLMSSGLGVKQSGLQWYYYELEQDGGEVTVKKGLACGGKSMPEDLLGATVTYEAAFPSIVANNSHAGRKATIDASSGQCEITFERTSTVIGATAAYYVDDSRPLPPLDQMASEQTPGWEDWDGDGKPGITMTITGLASGKRWCVLREINDWGGSYAPGATTFKLGLLDAMEELTAYGATSEILNGSSTPLSDPSVQFAQFAKLEPGQVQGDDAAICQLIRDLAPTLAPEANSKRP